jgi:hypothetical protein
MIASIFSQTARRCQLNLKLFALSGFRSALALFSRFASKNC